MKINSNLLLELNPCNSYEIFRIKSSYEYKEEKAGQGKKIMRDDGGRVKT
jgi:hypothetical protein